MLRTFCLLLIVAVLGCEPMGPIAGGALEGQPAEVPDGWNTVDEVMTFQLETRIGKPYSVNLWGVVVDDRLYVASGDGPDTRWVGHLADDPRVRLRVVDRLYELRATQVEEAEELEAVRQRYIEKYEIEDDPDMQGEFGEHAWVYRLEAR